MPNYLTKRLKCAFQPVPRAIGRDEQTASNAHVMRILAHLNHLVKCLTAQHFLPQVPDKDDVSDSLEGGTGEMRENRLVSGF